ncbi:MAG: sigma-70 family RNA polymerase sigma factor [Chloroflexota bacterium]|nr:sigma-70 family RNA polymerase sigma factor [Chloroflexota bacterium]
MDQDLVVRVQHGDQRAFEALALADSARLHRVAYGVLRDSESAEDATQRALVDIWRGIRRLRDPAKYEAWSYRLLVHACYREARQRRDLPRITDIPEPAAPAAGDAFGQVDDRDQLERGFRQLSVEHRTIIVLRCLLDMPMEQVAEALGIAPGTVGSRLHRALRALRAALEAEGSPATRPGLQREAVR